MKGVKYNLILTNVKGEKINFKKQSMAESIIIISKFFIENYSVEPCVSRNTVYNIIHKRGAKRTLLKQKCEINKYVDEINEING